MSWITHIPDKLVVAYGWTTDILIARSGVEQRIALRQSPRTEIAMEFLSDSYEDTQQWRYEMFSALDDAWFVPMWAEAEKITEAITPGAALVKADFTLMDDTLGSNGTTSSMMLLHPNGVTYEIHDFSLPRSATQASLATATVVNTYPLGSTIVPVEECYIDNNSGYASESVNAAHVSVKLIAKYNNLLVGKGAVALPEYQGVPVLDKRPISHNAQDTFWENISRLDFGHKVQLKSEQGRSNIASQRKYKISTREDRQWFKLFLATVTGRQKTFYCSTFREDMTVVSQPTVGGSTFTVSEASSVADGWKFSGAHQSLSIETADGVTQYRTLYGDGTVDNGNGTHTVYVTTPFTGTSDGSTIVKVSFLELVRMQADEVRLTYDHDGSIIDLPVRTIITDVVDMVPDPPISIAYGFGSRPFGLRTFGPNMPQEQLVVKNFGSRVFGRKTFGSV